MKLQSKRRCSPDAAAAAKACFSGLKRFNPNQPLLLLLLLLLNWLALGMIIPRTRT